jgi:DNA-binding CsgD family transcriptional regulator
MVDWQQPMILNAAIADLIDGVLIATFQQELLYANDNARKILGQLASDNTQANGLPQEIWHICQSLIHSRSLFPHQHWLIESDVLIDDRASLHIRVRWLRLDAIALPCLLITVEDRHQAMRCMAVEEAQKYRLTAREKEVWLLHRANYTYKQIALELNITPNTVKKHMRSIHIKQKAR